MADIRRYSKSIFQTEPSIVNTVKKGAGTVKNELEEMRGFLKKAKYTGNQLKLKELVTELEETLGSIKKKYSEAKADANYSFNYLDSLNNFHWIHQRWMIK